MKQLQSKELRQMWLDYFAGKGHTAIGSASIIPENDPTVLFTTAGMHPLVPYLMGETHPGGKRLVNVQKCIRTGDIEEVGDSSHLTFFEMLGNWSLGDYFKKEMIPWSYEFLTSPHYLGIDPANLAVSVFEGDADCPKDTESAGLWADCGIPVEKIFYLPKKNNWWGPAGMTGPCGPDTEMFIDDGRPACGPDCSPACDCGKYLEIWNNVFMQYFKAGDGSYAPLASKNVDTGMGLERTLCVLQGKASVFETDLFADIIACIQTLCEKPYSDTDPASQKAMRIVADHLRTSVFIIGDENGVTCSNVDQGYILRRLLRRAIRFAKVLELKKDGLTVIAQKYIAMYGEIYRELKENASKILDEIRTEEERFERTISKGMQEFEKLCKYLVGDTISGKAAFRLYDTYGFPIEMTIELAKERHLQVNVEDFNQAFAAHQKQSSAGADAKFKGGLSDNTIVTARLHTATHLLHKALKVVLNDEHVNQKGSNITEERLRFDFTFGRPLTDSEIQEVETLVNAAIHSDYEVTCSEMDIEDAKRSGAIGLFASKYGEKVKVYSMGNFSKEICGGPHAKRTGELGTFKILKEQSSSAGVRRIKAVLQ